MIDIPKQIEFWRLGSAEDAVVARDLVARGKIRHGLFFLHLAIEKALKAEVCRATTDVAPRVHNLVRLAELANLTFGLGQIDALAELNAFNIEGRYPEGKSVIHCGRRLLSPKRRQLAENRRLESPPTSRALKH
jgi:HEPN domain-containing protein